MSCALNKEPTLLPIVFVIRELQHARFHSNQCPQYVRPADSAIESSTYASALSLLKLSHGLVQRVSYIETISLSLTEFITTA